MSIFEALSDQALEPKVKRSKDGYDYELHEVLVRATNVSLSFGDKVVLKPTSVEVRDIHRPGHTQGQVVGILGPSGVGKTIFSRILAGLQQPTSGSVTISNFFAESNGKIHQPVRPGLVGMVAQSYPLFPHRTVGGNLLIAQEHSRLDMKHRLEKAREYLPLFELAADTWDRYPAQLSGGQRQRVAIIQQLLCSEKFMVMDEPFTGLDPISKDAVCEVINKVASLDTHMTIFVVAHDISALIKIADQLWLFGREQDEKGNHLPTGATIKFQLDLIERGLAWRPDMAGTPEFVDCQNEVRKLFETL